MKIKKTQQNITKYCHPFCQDISALYAETYDCIPGQRTYFGEGETRTERVEKGQTPITAQGMGRLGGGQHPLADGFTFWLLFFCSVTFGVLADPCSHFKTPPPRCLSDPWQFPKILPNEDDQIIAFTRFPVSFSVPSPRSTCTNSTNQLITLERGNSVKGLGPPPCNVWGNRF